MKTRTKRAIKIFLCVFFVSFMFINWKDISWIFNYHAITRFAQDSYSSLYQPSQSLVASSYPVSTVVDNKKSLYPYSEKENSLEIPRIGIVAPVVISQSTVIETIVKELDAGAVYYPGSVLPVEEGQIIILGHSAPPGWPKIKHDWIFSDINNLQPGDEIILYFEHRKYIYEVVQKSILESGQEISLNGFSPTDNVLTLVSCWPPGKLYKRDAVQAKLE